MSEEKVHINFDTIREDMFKRMKRPELIATSPNERIAKRAAEILIEMLATKAAQDQFNAAMRGGLAVAPDLPPELKHPGKPR
jgi:hypothetical protein